MQRITAWAALLAVSPHAGKFTIVTVDDRIPCKPGTTKPAFTQPNGNELWAMMLEKAFAKFVGSYAALESGQVAWAWEAITGEHSSMHAASPPLGLFLATSQRCSWQEF